MSVRTYIRTFLNDLFKNNFIVKAFVNIYYNFRVESPESVKFSFEKPIKELEGKKMRSFQSITGDKIDCK